MSATTCLGLLAMAIAAPVISWAIEMGQVVLTVNGLN